jgi:hypothetical protein
MADMTSATMATWTPEVWSAKPTVTYRANTVNVPLLDHTWEPELGVGRGDLVNIPGFSQNLTPNNRGAGSGTFGTGATITFDAVTEAQLQLKVDRFYYKAFRQPVEAETQVMPQYIPLLVGGQGEAIQIQVDADVASDNSNGFDAFSTWNGTDNVDITEDNLNTIEVNLNNQNSSVMDRFAVLSPASIGSVRKIEAIRNSLYASTVGNLSGNRGAGFIGNALTFSFFMSNNLEAGTAGKKNAVFQREAIAFAEQIGLRTVRDLNIEDGVFFQFLTYNTVGFLIIKNSFGNELDGK